MSRSLPGFQRGTISPQRGPEGPPPEEGRKHHCCSRYGPAQGQSSSRPSLLTLHLEGRGGAYAPQRTPVMTETASRYFMSTSASSEALISVRSFWKAETVWPLALT